MNNQRPRRRPEAAVTVVGAGLVGLTTALALADRGLTVRLIGEPLPGESSPAGAGMLAPGIENPSAAPGAAGAGAGAGTREGIEAGGGLGVDAGVTAHGFFRAARDRYVGYVQDLFHRSGVPVALNRRGILQVSLDQTSATAFRRRATAESPFLEPDAVAALEPPLARTMGALLHPTDGAVDNSALLRALDIAIQRTPGIARLRGLVTVVQMAADGVICSVAGSQAPVESSYVVLAAGAWAGGIAGLPRHLPIEPIRGQMMSVAAIGAAALRHVVYGPDAYLVPRGDRILIGATMEWVGFDATTTDAAVAELRERARALWPPMGATPTLAAWAGLRPGTPDLLPIVGPDPEYPALMYACGHSRSGILMAPLTGDCIAALVVGDSPPVPLDAFRPDRFANVAS